ncbi:ABC transporter permease subunit [Brachybacterium sp. GPGPB12]|uniref:ABC transporter permease n=1 Tax=Brachybacterium sp. GPGPB12 TaxID=3023517 RepID=UPI0031344C26
MAFAPHMPPGAAVGILWLFMFDPNYGLSRWAFSLFGADSPAWTTTSDWSLWSITIAYTWRRLGFVTVICYTAILDLPKDLYEAAALDGAHGWKLFRHLTLPPLSPITFFLSITGIISAAQAFDIISIMTDGGPGTSSSTLSWMVYEEAFQKFDIGGASAAATVFARDPPGHHLRAGPLRREEGELRLMSTLSSAPSAQLPDGTAAPAGTSVPRNTGRRRGPRRRPWVTAPLIAGVLATIAVFLVPLYWLFSSALKPHQDIYSWPLQWIPTELTFSNFVGAWEAAAFDRFFLNSIITTGVGTVLEIVLAILCAYAFVFVEFRFKKIVFGLIVASLMLPGHVTLIVNYITVANLGWLNTYAGIILPGIASAFAMFLIYQHMRTIDKDILQAAEIDGAGHIRRMLTIVVPLSSPMILTATLIVMVGKWNEYVWPLIVTSTEDMRTLPIGSLFLRARRATATGA